MVMDSVVFTVRTGYLNIKTSFGNELSRLINYLPLAETLLRSQYQISIANCGSSHVIFSISLYSYLMPLRPNIFHATHVSSDITPLSVLRNIHFYVHATLHILTVFCTQTEIAEI
jgi:hypothetical protein